jgi:hypothetical protein
MSQEYSGSKRITKGLEPINITSPANDDVVQRKSGIWVNRNMAQLKTDLALNSADVGLSNVANVTQQPLNADLTAIAGLSPSNDDIIQRKSGAWVKRTLSQLKTDLVVINEILTSFSSAAGTLSSSDSIVGAVNKLDGNMSKAWAQPRNLMQASGTITAGITANTFMFQGSGTAMKATGSSSAAVPVSFYIDTTEWFTINGRVPKLQIRVMLYTNDVAPTGNYTFGLYPITRPATSGGAGAVIFDMGTVVTGSTCAFTTPAADGLLQNISSTFSLPTSGHYVLGVVTTATLAANSFVAAVAYLQLIHQ